MEYHSLFCLQLFKDVKNTSQVVGTQVAGRLGPWVVLFWVVVECSRRWQAMVLAEGGLPCSLLVLDTLACW